MSGDLVKIKALEWRDRKDGLMWAIDPFGGVYTCSKSNWTHVTMAGWLAGGPDGAQADYEARIMAALDIAPAPDPAKVQALVEALVQIAGKPDYADDPWEVARAALAAMEGQG